ncbi:MAG: TIGR02996 domain-containing protein [Kofleriaceae bacterium]
MTVRAALEAAIDRDPDDAAAYAVLADHLEELGDPRGRLIALQLAAERDPALGEAATAYLAVHRDDLARVYEAVTVRWSRGYARAVFADGVQRAYLSSSRRRETPGAILAHPSSRFLVELGVRDDDGGTEAWVDSLALAAPRGALRRLALTDHRFAELQLAALWPAVPALESLELAGFHGMLGAIALPALRRFAWTPARLTEANVRELATAAWPQLEELELLALAEDPPIATLFETVKMPRLQHLALHGLAVCTDAVAALAGSALAPALVTLDLSHGRLTDTCIGILNRFHWLERLDVSDNALTPAGVARLCGPAHVIAGDQREPDLEDPRDDGLFDY